MCLSTVLFFCGINSNQTSEGIPTLFVAIIAWLYLPNGPGECKFLTERENHIMATRAYRYRGGDTEKKINYRHIWSAFLDYKNYFTASIIFCLNVSSSLIIHSMPLVSLLFPLANHA